MIQILQEIDPLVISLLFYPKFYHEQRKEQPEKKEQYTKANKIFVVHCTGWAWVLCTHFIMHYAGHIWQTSFLAGTGKPTG